MQLPQIVEQNGIRVLTTRQLTEWYKTEEWQIKQNFRNNKERFVLGKHYITLQGEELKGFKSKVENIYLVGKTAKILYLWTEKGALLHAKSLNTDKAWEVYDYLVDFYFRAKNQAEESTNKLPERESSMKMVVDAPENIKIQQAMQEVRNRMTAINVMLDEANIYCSEEKYKKSIGNISDLWLSLGRKMVGLENIEPNIIEKKC